MACLDENSLQAFARGTLSAGELARAQAHIDECVPCRRLAAEVAADASQESAVAGTEPPPVALPSAEPSKPPGAYALGRYFVIETLGQGGMGQVLLAYDSKLDRKVALKRVRAHGAPLRPGARSGLLREAQAMARLSHPNVLTVHDAGELDGEVFIAMEYVRGHTLRDWLKEPRGWREILAMYCAAGEGLSAAHRAGLVHRDFKPDNVLVGEDGRIRVTDFGLAERGGGLEGPRTELGPLSGTPGYIAPEALLGKRGPLSDQFSFFVSLHEALHGERPFKGPTIVAQIEAAERGEIQPARPGRRVPKWLRRTVRTGLSADPGQRFPSMAEALAALSYLSERARRRWLVGGAAALGLVAFGAVASWAYERPARLCSGFERHLIGTWDEQGKQRVRAAFTSTGAPQAEATFQSVARSLDTWAESWVKMRTQTCAATTSVLGEHSVETMALKASCLDRRWMDFEAIIHRFSTSDGALLPNAVKAAASLPGLSECVNPTPLGGQTVPTDRTTKERYDTLRRQLAEARANLLVRAVEPGVKLTLQVEHEAKALELEVLRAEALIILGRLRDEAGEYPAAEESLVEGAALAMARGLDALGAEANIELVMVIGNRMRRFEEAHRWQKLAVASIARAGLSGQEPEARLLSVVGNMAAKEQSHALALESFKKSLAIRERLHGTEHVLVADVLHNLATERVFANLPEEAVEPATRALAIRERLLGPEHRDVAASVDLLGILVRRLGQVRQSLAFAERAVAIAERALPADHPFLAVFLVNLGLARSDAGDLRGAEDASEHALAIQRKSLGEGHPNVGATMENLVWLAILKGDYKRAIELAEEVARRFPEKSTEALADVGEAYRRAGRIDEARQRFELALQKLSTKPEERVQVFAMTGLAECELARGQRAQALGHLERALDLGARARLMPHRLALTQFALARALPAAEAGRARTLAREARSWLELTRRSAEVRRVDQFLAGLSSTAQ